MTRPRSLQKKFLLFISLIIVPVLGVVFSWVEIQNISQAREQALDKARILARQVVITRQWVTDCGGGVLVPAESLGARDAGCCSGDAISTELGPFVRFSPAMVTRRLSQYSSREQLYSFSLSSLSPKNPDNAPGPFEQEALNAFVRDGASEAWEFSTQGLEYVVPLLMEPGCLKCHDRDVSNSSAVMGGLTVLIPMDRIQAALQKSRVFLTLAAVVLTLMTIGTLFFLMRRMVINPLTLLEDKTREISRGNLEARVSIHTGDELERLGDAFNTMAQRLLEGRENLEKRIEQATFDLARANQELTKLDTLKSDFLANMSHELRSPLTVIRGGINYLYRTLEKPENRYYIEIIDKNVARLTRLVTDLFDFTKLEHGKIDWEVETENLTTLVREVIEIISPLSVEKSIDMVCTGPDELMVTINLERIEQVLVNLMDNAIKFSDPGTRIDVSLRQEGGWVIVSVRDQGPGIPPGRLASIFDKFSTIPTGRNSRTEGTGLGLAISKAIVEAHGGKIWATSIPGSSSTFCFSLPLWAPAAAQPDL
ncbi:MAG: ATP-binding protein [Pseudomonadota bacterium]